MSASIAPVQRNLPIQSVESQHEAAHDRLQSVQVVTPPPPAPARLAGIVATTLINDGTMSGVVQDPAPVVTPFLQIYDENGHREFASCGSASAVAVLARHGLFATVEGVDQHTRRPNNLGGSLSNLVDLFEQRGLEAKQYAGGKWDDLDHALRNGFSVVVTYSHESAQHTVLVTGLVKMADGTEYIRYQDWNGNTEAFMTRAEFEGMWENVRLPNRYGIKTGIGGTYMVIGPKGADLPSGSLWGKANALSAEVLHDAFTDLTVGAGYFKHGEIAGGVAMIASGVLQGVVQLPAGIVQVAGAGLEQLGDRGLEWAKKQFKEPSSFWDKLGAVFTFVFAGIAFGFGKFLRYTGQLVGAVTGLLARAIGWPLGRLGMWLHSDNEAAINVGYADRNGSYRARLHYMQLVQTSVKGKQQLIDQMLSGNTSNDERKMILRVLEAAKETNDLNALVAAVGAARLDELFRNTAEANAFHSLRTPAPKPAVKNSYNPAIGTQQLQLATPMR